MNRQFARAGRSGSVRRACGVFGIVALALSALNAAEEPQSVESLVAKLQTGDVPARRDASYFLQRLGPKAKDALPALIKALADEDKQVWSNSVAAIAAIGPEAKQAIPVLMEDLASKEGQGRGRRNFDRSQRMFRSAHALSRIGPAALPPLIQGLSSEDATLRAGSARALGGMGTVARESIPALIANLNHGDNDVQREVVEALAIMGAEAKASLIPALSDKDPRTRQSAVLALAAMGKDSNDVAAVMLERLSAETDANVRISLLTALPKLDADSRILVPRLIEGLKDSNESIRRASVNGLLSFPTAKKEIVEALTNQVWDKNNETSLRAAYVLGRFGSGAESAVPALLDVASMQTPPDQILVEALVQVGEPVVPRLLAAAEKVPLDQMTSEHWMVKCLQSMGSFAVNPVRNGLGHKNPSVRLLSVRALTALGRDAEDAATSLLEKLDDPEVRVRAAALGALVSVEAPSKLIVPRIEKSLNDPSPIVRLAAAQLVPKLGEEGKHLNVAVIGKLNDSDASVRRGILDSLGPEQSAAIPALVPLLDNAEARLPAMQALGRMGANAKPALPKLIELLPKLPRDGKMQALDTIASMGAGGAEAHAAIEPLRTDADAELRSRAIFASAAIEGNPETRAAMLAEALDDADGAVRKAAAEAIVPLGDKLGPSAPKLFAMLKTDRDRDLALATLRRVRVRDLELLKGALTLPEMEVKMYACEAIGRIGKDAREAASALEIVATDSNEEVARAARRAMRAIGAR